MKLSTHQLFAQLCESLVDLDEASSAMSLLGKTPGAQQVVKKLHSQDKLSHNQDFSKIQKISWSDLKNRWPSGWVLCTGPKGTGAIKARNGNYQAIASTGEEPVGFQDAKGGNVLDFLQGKLGGKWEKYTYWIGTENKYASDKANSRKQNSPEPKAMNQEALLKKFRPLWAKATQAAIADCKGMVATMVKNDAYEKAERKISQLKSLETVLDTIESGDTDVPSAIKGAIGSAIVMAASHYYPDETGEISKPRYGGGYSSERSEGTTKLLQDLSNGDTKKLGTVLGFFKRSLISG
jgi:hypothetical protein